MSLFKSIGLILLVFLRHQQIWIVKRKNEGKRHIFINKEIKMHMTINHESFDQQFVAKAGSLTNIETTL